MRSRISTELVTLRCRKFVALRLIFGFSTFGADAIALLTVALLALGVVFAGGFGIANQLHIAGFAESFCVMIAIWVAGCGAFGSGHGFGIP